MLFLLISISACSKKKAVEKKLEDIRTGTQGIVMNFLPNAPPDKIHVGENPNADNTFDVILEVRNKGAYPQPNEGKSPDGVVILSGYDPNIITFNRIEQGEFNYESMKEMALEGKSTINPNGGLDLVIFKGFVTAENVKVDKYEPTLLATACYQYRTVAGPSVCIDPDPYSTVNLKKVCQIQSISLSNQGAPIAVTRIDEEAFARKTQFKITIKNAGGGDVFTRQQGDTKCLKLERNDIDKVWVEEVRVGNKLLNCRPFIDGATSGNDGYMRLINGEGFIICEFSDYGSASTTYITPMTIRLLYDYRNTAEKKIQIKKEIGGISGSGTDVPSIVPSIYHETSSEPEVGIY